MFKKITLAAMLITASPTMASECIASNGDDGYVNSSHHCVPRPSDGNHQQTATATCRDGEFSYSEHHSGTCSGHGGVRSWIR